MHFSCHLPVLFKFSDSKKYISNNRFVCIIAHIIWALHIFSAFYISNHQNIHSTGRTFCIFFYHFKMINESFEFSCNCKCLMIYQSIWNINQISILSLNNKWFFLFWDLGDDDSDIGPHDLEGVDVEYGLSSYRNIGQHSFSQMQAS